MACWMEALIWSGVAFLSVTPAGKARAGAVNGTGVAGSASTKETLFSSVIINTGMIFFMEKIICFTEAHSIPTIRCDCKVIIFTNEMVQLLKKMQHFNCKFIDSENLEVDDYSFGNESSSPVTPPP